MLFGTSYFVSKETAIAYYKTQGYAVAEDAKEYVECALQDKIIFIGKPAVERGEHILINKKEGRYFIETND